MNEPTLQEKCVTAASRIYSEHRIDNDAKLEVNEEGVWIQTSVFLYHYEIDTYSDPTVPVE
jgi:hypothetical protein